MTTSTLESRDYVATDADITHLAAGMLLGQTATDTLPRKYLRAIIATTIHALDAPQRQRSGKVVKLSDEDQARQLGELEKVIARFYPLIVAKYQAELPAGPGRAEELNRLTNWARGAHRDVRNWIRAGHDIRPVAAARATKATMAVTPRTRAASPGRIKTRVERASKALVVSVMELAASDKAAAIAEIELLIGQLGGQLAELGVKATTDAKTAAAEHQLLRVGKSTFFPTQSQVVRQMENPS